MNTQQFGRITSAMLFAAAFVIVALSLPSGAAAQIPDEFTNLKVFDKNIGKGELVGIMRKWSGALGVRCNYCHVGGSEESLEGMEFDKDDKQAKKTARRMVSMVNMINGDFIGKLKGSSNTGMKVECVTCHRGQAHPRQMSELLSEAHEKGGYQAAATVYDSLRAEYYGSHTFDFQASVMTSLAENLARKGEIEAALKYLKLNERHNPESVWNLLMMGQLYMQSGDKESAVSSINKVLELEPDNALAKRLLDRINKG